MKKLVVVVAVVAMLAMSLTGCKKKTECDMCGEVKRCDSYEVLGEDVWMCDDCHDGLEAIGNLLK